MSSAFPRLCLLSVGWLVGWQPLMRTGLQETGGGILLHIRSPAAFFQKASRHLHNPDAHSHTLTRQTSTRSTVFTVCAHTQKYKCSYTHAHTTDTSWHSDEVGKRSILVQNVCVCGCVCVSVCVHCNVWDANCKSPISPVPLDRAA